MSLLKALKFQIGTTKLEGGCDHFREKVMPIILNNEHVYQKLEKITGLPMVFFAAAHSIKGLRANFFQSFLFSDTVKIDGEEQFIESAALTLQGYLSGIPENFTLVQIVYLWDKLFSYDRLWGCTNKSEDKLNVGIFAAYCMLAKKDINFLVEPADSQLSVYTMSIKEVGRANG